MEVCRANGYKLELKCDRRDIKRRGWWKAGFPGFWSLLFACIFGVSLAEAAPQEKAGYVA